MEIKIPVSDFNDQLNYQAIRASDKYFSPDYTNQEVFVTKNTLLVKKTFFMADKFLANDNEFVFGEHLLAFCELNLEEIATKIKSPTFAIGDNENLYNFLQDAFGINTAIFRFLPKINTDFSKAFSRYFTYLDDLQKEYQEIIKFCFDEEFHPTYLNKMTPLARLNVYLSVYKRPFDHTMQKEFSAPQVDVDILVDKFTEIALNKAEIKSDQNELWHNSSDISTLINTIPEEEILAMRNEFEQEFNLMPGLMAVLGSYTKDINFNYRCSNLEQFLYIEFATLCENNFRIKKCNRCGRYFIIKGNYHGNYCNRPEQNGRTCQQIAAGEKYKEKTHSGIAWKLYSRYYKRYFARIKVGTITKENFKKWQYAATVMRDDCLTGNVSVSDFENFLQGSFANRRGKKD